MQQTLKLQWTGIRPLIMLNPQTVRISNPYAKKNRELNRAMKTARRKGQEDIMVKTEMEQIKNDFEASAYWDDKAKRFYIPDTQVLECLKAALGRYAKDIDRCVIVSDATQVGPECRIYIDLPGGKKFDSLQEAFDEGMAYRMECPCRIPPKTGPLIWKCRCMVPTGWSATMTLQFEDTMLTRNTLIVGGFDGGRMFAMGAWRPKFGRFLQKWWNPDKEAWDDTVVFEDVEPPKKVRRTKKAEEPEPALV